MSQVEFLPACGHCGARTCATCGGAIHGSFNDHECREGARPRLTDTAAIERALRLEGVPAPAYVVRVLAKHGVI